MPVVKNLQELRIIYEKIKSVIKGRLKEFREIYKEDDPRIFAELSFCILTPQSKAKVCWKAIESLMKSGKLYEGTAEEIMIHLKGVRFYRTKAERIVKARETFRPDGTWKLKSALESFKNDFELRDWFVKNVKGFGYKEASHFLRNIGRGEEFAILDRHILKNLLWLGVIEKIPNSLTKKRYLEIEGRMKKFCEEIEIPMSHLDLLLWFKETGDVFK